MYNYEELKERVAILVGRSGDSDFKSKIGVWLNLGIEFLENTYDYWNELQDIYNFTTVADRESYPMPNQFIKPLRIYDLTNNKHLTIKAEEEYFDGNISNIADAETGVPEYARLFGISGSRVEISTSGKTLQAKSSSASDTNSPVVRIRGYTDTNHLIEEFEDITISSSTPTTYATATTPKTFYKLTHVSKSIDTVGYITLADSDGTILEYLNPVGRVARHKILKLGLIPADAYSMRTLFKKTAVKMINDNDYPFTECDDFLILDSWGWALSQEKETMERAVTIWSKAERALHAILTREMGKLGPDFQHKITSKWLVSHRR